MTSFDGRLAAGVDEAGRGPLAGPVVAGAVMLDACRPIAGLADSKSISAARREALAALIIERSLAWSVGWCDRAEIDVLNILQATMLAMRRAILGLRIQPALVQVDGNRLPSLRFGERVLHGEAVIGGDRLVPSISAASILAKVWRDRIMQDMDRQFPGYGFARHKGYGTVEHINNINILGPCPEHRLSFRPLSQLAQGAAPGRPIRLQ